jgi:hypothetical protein
MQTLLYAGYVLEGQTAVDVDTNTDPASSFVRQKQR